MKLFHRPDYVSGLFFLNQWQASFYETCTTLWQKKGISTFLSASTVPNRS
ncbi:hypothetical protein [Emticicia agri]|nr:hypothetical protein [Emticicia agri]